MERQKDKCTRGEDYTENSLHNSVYTLSTTTAHRCSISLHAYISAMKRYGVRQPLQEFEKFLEMFWLCYA